MKKTNLLAVLGMAAVLTVGMSFGAMAAPLTNVTGTETFNFKKEITTDGYTYLPNATFNFTIAPVTEENNSSKIITDSDGNLQTVNVKSGVAGATVGAATFETIDTVVNTANVIDSQKTSYTKDVTVDLSNVEFVAPGVYHYTIHENGTSGDNASTAVEGMNYDTTNKDLYAFVENDGDGYKVTNVVIADEDGNKLDTITNNYGNGDNDSTHDVTFTKTVTGNQGDLTHQFAFELLVNGVTDEKYMYTITGTNAGTAVLTSGTAATVSLKSGETVKVFGLSANDKVTFTETEANQNGYTTTDSVNGGVTLVTGAQGTDGIIAGTVNADDATGTVTNDRVVNTPTGVVMNVAPYALMVVAALGLGGMFLTKKKHED